MADKTVNEWIQEQGAHFGYGKMTEEKWYEKHTGRKLDSATDLHKELAKMAKDGYEPECHARLPGDD
jgi:hypothetical protein